VPASCPSRLTRRRAAPVDTIRFVHRRQRDDPPGDAQARYRIEAWQQRGMSQATLLRRKPLLLVDRCNTASVPTDIYFAGDNVRVSVDEDPSQVAEAFTSADGLPFCLTGQGARGEVYINPATVAFWSASDSSPEPGAPQDSPPKRTERPPVDIWGNPLRKKRRR